MDNVIQQLKDNEKPFGLMSAEMKRKMHSLDTKYLQTYEIGEWLDLALPLGETQDVCQYTYRLRADYKEKPEIEEWPTFELDGDLRYKRNLADRSDKGFCIDMASRNPDFIGFKFEDGRFTKWPIRYIDTGHTLLTEITTMSSPWPNFVKVLHATHVLFRRKKQE